MNPYSEKVYKNDGLDDLVNLIPEDAKRILDVGCGAGDIARSLKRPSREIHGITMSPIEAEHAKEHLQKVIVGDVQTWKPDYPAGSFDAIVLSHIIEHLAEPALTLKRLLPLLKKNGRFYIAAPNVLFWKQRLLFMLGKFDYTDHGIMDRTHLRFFTPASLQKMIEEQGLRIVEKKAVGHFPWGPVRRVFPKLTHQLDVFLCNRLPTLFGFHLIVTAEA